MLDDAGKCIGILRQCLDDPESYKSSDIIKSLKDLSVDTIDLFNYYWVLLDLYKDNDNFKDILVNIGADLLNEYSETDIVDFQSSEFAKYCYSVFDLELIIKKWELINKEDFKNIYEKYKKNFEIYSSFNENPEGYARIIYAILKGMKDEIHNLCGEHNIVLSSVVLLSIDLYIITNSSNVLNVMTLFDKDTVLTVLIEKVRSGSFFGHEKLFVEMISDIEDYIQFYIDHLDVFDKLYDRYIDVVKEYAREKQKSKVYSDVSTGKAAKMYHDYYELIQKLPIFSRTLTIESDEEFIKAINVLIRYDPCQFKAIRDRVLKILYSMDPDSDDYFQILFLVGSNCNDVKFIVTTSRNENTPHFIYSDVLIPSVLVMSTRYQLLGIIFNDMVKKFRFSLRCRIYEDLDDCQLRYVNQILNRADAKRKFNSTRNKVSKGRVFKIISTLSELMAQDPINITREYLSFIEDNGGQGRRAFLDKSEELSPFVLDLICWHILNNIDENILNAGCADIIEMSYFYVDLESIFYYICEEVYTKNRIGGLIFFNEIFKIFMDRGNEKSKEYLKKSLCVGNLSLCFIGIFGYLQSTILYDDSDLKFEYFDIIMDAVENLGRVFDTDDDSVSVISKLINEYKVSYHMAFFYGRRFIKQDEDLSFTVPTDVTNQELFLSFWCDRKADPIEFSRWLSSKENADEFIDKCILPRIIYSMDDSRKIIYFIGMINDRKVEKALYEALLSRFHYILVSLTEREIKFYTELLRHIFSRGNTFGVMFGDILFEKVHILLQNKSTSYVFFRFLYENFSDSFPSKLHQCEEIKEYIVHDDSEDGGIGKSKSRFIDLLNRQKNQIEARLEEERRRREEEERIRKREEEERRRRKEEEERIRKREEEERRRRKEEEERRRRREEEERRRRREEEERRRREEEERRRREEEEERRRRREEEERRRRREEEERRRRREEEDRRRRREEEEERRRRDEEERRKYDMHRRRGDSVSLYDDKDKRKLRSHGKIDSREIDSRYRHSPDMNAYKRSDSYDRHRKR